jgi:hypothetical protein
VENLRGAGTPPFHFPREVRKGKANLAVEKASWSVAFGSPKSSRRRGWFERVLAVRGKASEGQKSQGGIGLTSGYNRLKGTDLWREKSFEVENSGCTFLGLRSQAVLLKNNGKGAKAPRGVRLVKGEKPRRENLMSAPGMK